MHTKCDMSVCDMSSLEQFKIDLKGLSEGDNVFDFDLSDSYFEAIQAPAVQRGRVHSSLTIRRTGDVFYLDFHTDGFVIVPCDLCLEDMEQPIESDDHLVAKFGEDYSEDDDLVTVREDNAILDVSWFIYEFIELSIPLRHVHAPGKCDPAMMKILQEHSAARSGDEDTEPVDSRWAALKKIKDKN